MRYYYLFALFSLLFLPSGCKQYQVFSFTSDQVGVIEKKGFYTGQPQDSIHIFYQWFAGDNKGVVEIENKGSEMAYVDLAQSSVIVNGIKQGLFAEIGELYASKQYSTKKLAKNLYATGVSISKTKRQYKLMNTETYNQEVVLPNSKSRYWLPAVSLMYQKLAKDTAFHKTNLTESEMNSVLFLDMKKFDKTETPILLRVFLVYKVGKTGKEQIVDKTFWIHQVVNIKDTRAIKILSNEKKAPPIDKNSFNKLIIKK